MGPIPAGEVEKEGRGRRLVRPQPRPADRNDVVCPTDHQACGADSAFLSDLRIHELLESGRPFGRLRGRSQDGLYALARARNTSATPPSTATETRARRRVKGSASSRVPPSAARMGTLSCTEIGRASCRKSV